MEQLLDIPVVPIGGGIGAFITLFVYFVRRSDKWTLENLHELRRQRDEALKRASKAEGRASQMAAERDRALDSLAVYRRYFGELPPDAREITGELPRQ